MKAKIHSQLFLILLLLLASHVQAVQVVDGKLGLWLQGSAADRLTEVLARHPRLQGERIKIMAMKDGSPQIIADRLTAQISEQITHNLLSNANIQIVAGGLQEGCNPTRTSTILGIEVKRHDARSHRVTLAVVDTDEGVWVNGTNMKWQGRLTALQRRAYESRVPQSPGGNLFTAAQTAEIAGALFEQLQCHAGLAAPLYFEPGEDSFQNRLLLRLRERIRNLSLTTVNRTSAASIVTLVVPQTTMGEVSLVFSSPIEPARKHRLAAVTVTGLAGTSPELATIGSSSAPGPGAQDPYSLISNITITEGRDRKAPCDPKSSKCVNISFELFRSAYLVHFYTRNGSIQAVDCALPEKIREGRQQFGIKVRQRALVGRPDVGFYALAFTSRSAATAVHKALRQVSSKCARGNAPPDTRMATFRHTLERYREQMDWRSLHVMRDNHGVAML